MTEDKLAKTLLLSKTCYCCYWNTRRVTDKPKCVYGLKGVRKLPESRTCKSWLSYD